MYSFSGGEPTYLIKNLIISIFTKSASQICTNRHRGGSVTSFCLYNITQTASGCVFRDQRHPTEEAIVFFKLEISGKFAPAQPHPCQIFFCKLCIFSPDFQDFKGEVKFELCVAGQRRCFCPSTTVVPVSRTASSLKKSWKPVAESGKAFMVPLLPNLLST